MPLLRRVFHGVAAACRRGVERRTDRWITQDAAESPKSSRLESAGRTESYAGDPTVEGVPVEGTAKDGDHPAGAIQRLERAGRHPQIRRD